MHKFILGGAAVGALVLSTVLPAPAAQAVTPPYPFGEAGKSCSAMAPGAYVPRLPEASPRSEPLWAADLTAVTENTAGAVPSCSNGRWTFSTNPSGSWFNKRRSEVMWSTNSGTTADLEGKTLTYKVRFLGRLGADVTSTSSPHWHGLWQVHGRTWGQWRNPLVMLSIQQGRLVLAGNNNQWVRILAPYRDDTIYEAVITIRFSQTQGQGWVSVNLNGQQITDYWSPAVPTLAAGMDMLQQRSGLYHGTNAGSVSGAPQVVYMEFPQ